MSDQANTLLDDTWVWPGNLRPFIETVSRWIGYDFDDSDWSALEYGLVSTDNDAGRWFTYPLVGDPILEMSVAQNDGGEPVSVRVDAPAGVQDDLHSRIRAAADIFNTFRVV